MAQLHPGGGGVCVCVCGGGGEQGILHYMIKMCILGTFHTVAKAQPEYLFVFNL